MEREIFENSNEYLSILKECHLKNNLFKHLENDDNIDVLEIIHELYMNDDFTKLFDPIYGKLSWNDSVGLATFSVIVMNYCLIQKSSAYLFLVRTNSYYYNIISGEISKEDNYKLNWFKETEIEDNLGSLLDLLINQSAYYEIDGEDYEKYNEEDIIHIYYERFGKDDTYALIPDNAELKEEEEEEEDLDNTENEEDNEKDNDEVK